MPYIQLNFTPLADNNSEILQALLYEQDNISGIEEQDNCIIAYTNSAENFDPNIFQNIAQNCNFTLAYEELQEQNWNEIWESNFEPITIEGFCHIRAAFHPENPTKTPYEIIITPKMSFGTGHHATTRMVMECMRELNFKGKKVLDFGTGTGILAILAAMLHASEINAIDNDHWCIENATENVQLNNVHNIEISDEDITAIDKNQYYDIILANINRQILLDYFTAMKSLLTPNGIILLSGILEEDMEIICTKAKAHGMQLTKEKRLNRWMALQFAPLV